MKKEMNEKGKRNSGMLTVEACVSVTIFTLFIIFMSSFLVYFMAQNEMSHALVATAESLSLDSYYNDATYGGSFSEANKEVTVESLMLNLFDNSYSSINNNKAQYVNTSRWYVTLDGKVNAEVIKERFIGYVSPSGEREADDILKGLNIKNGINGIDFTESKIENGKLFIKAKYKFHFFVKLNGLDEFEVTQSVCSGLWKF